MKRVKQKIIALISVLKDDDRAMVLDAVDAADRYADEIHVALAHRHDPPPALYGDLAGVAIAHAIPLPSHNPRFRSVAYQTVLSGYSPERTYVVFLEVGQRFSHPDLVRPTIEYNEGMVITAMRYFLWDEEHHRVDGFYRPIRLPFAGPLRDKVHWVDAYSTAPEWMWNSRSKWIEAPFAILDQIFLYPDYRWDDGTPMLKPTESVSS